ncbi:surface carbohydrate biosynthesis protein [Halomonas sp. BC04]|uniref:surface carbohydrate biosynthesis protein n=1 Tax=Halomonas sp. BC04 TaxID=1403540 RepID=UPI0018CC659A|nr:surface carbohydrate biosynthesis protein [Halomonas sp. BC04]
MSVEVLPLRASCNGAEPLAKLMIEELGASNCACPDLRGGGGEQSPVYPNSRNSGVSVERLVTIGFLRTANGLKRNFMNYLFPIETIARELDYRLFFSVMLVKPGDKIFIGQHDFIQSIVPAFKGGVYVGKNIFLRRSNVEDGARYYCLKERGIDVVYLHEEGAVFLGEPADWGRNLLGQYNLDFFDKNDEICTWGEYQKKFDEGRSSNINISVTGHPRFDLYKNKYRSYYKEDVVRIKNKYNRFILINGRYGVCNHGQGVSYVFSELGGYNPLDSAERVRSVEIFCHYTRQLSYMVELAHKLVIDFPDLKIVYRPHPSEDRSYYEKVFGGVENIFVDDEGSVGPWLIAAEAVIHDGCTTAIEATLSGTKVINYKPDSNERLDIWLPNQLGIKASDYSEVVNILRAKNPQSYKAEKVSSLASDLLFNFENDSFQALLNVVNTAAIRNKKRHGEENHPSHLQIMLKFLGLKVKTAIPIRLDKRNQWKYHHRKFPGFDKRYVLEKLEKAGKALDKAVMVDYYNDNLLCVYLP